MSIENLKKELVKLNIELLSQEDYDNIISTLVGNTYKPANKGIQP